ncbi:MAG: hypothetical protein M3274_00330 [Actinomycetota bacterium]|nr:hypothetical protein [Actinomycetota bacterium]
MAHRRGADIGASALGIGVFRGIALRWFNGQHRADAPAAIPVVPDSVGRRPCNDMSRALGNTQPRTTERRTGMAVECSLAQRRGTRPRHCAQYERHPDGCWWPPRRAGDIAGASSISHYRHPEDRLPGLPSPLSGGVPATLRRFLGAVRR